MKAQSSSTHDHKAIQKTNLQRVIYIAICFMVLFTAYCTAQNLADQMYSQLGYGSLGKVCLFLIFGFTSIASPIASHFKSLVPRKFGMIVGASAYASFIFAGVLTSYCFKEGLKEGFCNPTLVYSLNVLTAILVGIGGAFLWLLQSLYVDTCADESTKGLYNGLFWSIFQTAQIIGSTLAAAILGVASQFTFYSVLSVFAITAMGMLSMVQAPVEYGPPAQEEKKNETFAEAMSRFSAVVHDKSYHFFYVSLLFSGVAIGSYIAFLSAVIESTVDSTDTSVINQRVGYVFLALAFGEVGAGLTVGKFADKFDKLKVFRATMLINEVALGMAVLACVFKSYYFAMISGMLFGYGDTGIQTMISTIIGFLFNGKPELFSAYRFFQCQGLVLSCFVAVFIPRSMPMLFLVIIAGVLMMCHMAYVKLLPKEYNSSDYHMLTGEKRIMIELERI